MSTPIKCTTCLDSQKVYVVCFRRLTPPVEVTEGIDPTPTSFVIEQVLVACPDCNRSELHIEPGPAL